MPEPIILSAAMSPLLNASVVAASLTGILTALGWFVTRRLDVQAQKRVNEAQFRRAHVQKQIEEFYGPLYSLVWQIFAINDLKDKILGNEQIDPQTRDKIEDYFATKYFLPLHGRVGNILETKLYLVEGTHMPDSIFAYVESAMQEPVQRELWSGSSIDTSFVKGMPWPDAFYEDIEGPLKKLMAEYETDVQLLTGKVEAFGVRFEL